MRERFFAGRGVRPRLPRRAAGSRRRGAGILVALALVAAAGCQAPARAPAVAEPPGSGPIAFPAAEYRALAGRGAVYVLDPAASAVRVFVYRGGPLARLGHNHVAAATDFRGAVFLPDDPADGRFDLVVPVAGLALDRPADRRAAGAAFAGELSDEAIRDTRANMLGPDLLDAGRHPHVVLRALRIEGALPVLEVTAEVVLRGARHETTVPVWVRRAGGRLVVEGQLRLRHADFGLEPFSAAGGALRVQDAIGVRFRLVGERRERPFAGDTAG